MFLTGSEGSSTTSCWCKYGRLHLYTLFYHTVRMNIVPFTWKCQYLRVHVVNSAAAQGKRVRRERSTTVHPVTGGMSKTGENGRGREASWQMLVRVSKHLLNEPEWWVPLGTGNGLIWLQSWVMRLQLSRKANSARWSWKQNHKRVAVGKAESVKRSFV